LRRRKFAEDFRRARRGHTHLISVTDLKGAIPMLASLLAAMRSLSSWLFAWSKRRQLLAALHSLDDDSLAELGLAREDIPGPRRSQRSLRHGRSKR